MSAPSMVPSSSGIAKMRLKTPNQLQILAFGDSLTEGYTDFGTRFHPYGPSLQTKLSELLPEFTSIKVDVEGRSGDCVLNSLHGRFEERLHTAIDHGTRSYDLVIVLGGTNDLAYKSRLYLEGSTQIFEQGLKRLYEYILSTTDANLLVMTVPERAIDTKDDALGKKMKESREYLNGLISQWVQEQGERVLLMDLAAKAPFQKWKHSQVSEEEVSPEDLWSPDGLHMSAHGYDFVGRELAEVIFSLL